jgi:hypothetical protein
VIPEVRFAGNVLVARQPLAVHFAESVAHPVFGDERLLHANLHRVMEVLERHAEFELLRARATRDTRGSLGKSANARGNFRSLFDAHLEQLDQLFLEGTIFRLGAHHRRARIWLDGRDGRDGVVELHPRARARSRPRDARSVRTLRLSTIRILIRLNLTLLLLLLLTKQQTSRQFHFGVVEIARVVSRL